MPDVSGRSSFAVDGHIVRFYNDEDLVPRRYTRLCRFRPNWIYQQILKLCQQATKTPFYFCIDADCMPMRRISLFDEKNRAALFSCVNQQDETAFIRCIAKFSGGELAQWTTDEYAETRYIADMQLFSRRYTLEMLQRYWHDLDEFQIDAFFNSFWLNIPGIRSRSIFMSEYEMYGRFCMKFHENDVFVKTFTRHQEFKYTGSQSICPFSQVEISEAEKRAEEANVDFLKLQSNCGHSDVKYASGGGHA